jgi:L-serine dehydratase
MKQDEAAVSKMSKALAVMREAIVNGLDEDLRSHSGMSGGNAFRLKSMIDSGKLEDNVYNRAAAYALATAETNACMGRIVAAPTAGASGVLPAVLIAAAEIYDTGDEKLIDALFLAGEIGAKIAKEASFSGAECGCQAECGSAAAMAAGGMVYLMDGTYEQSENAAALALKSLLGLVCDPVAGLVEVPCVKRNANCASIAITSANMSISGIKSVIPFDEVIKAMKKIGQGMPASLKETAEGGCAATDTGKRIADELLW